VLKMSENSGSVVSWENGELDNQHSVVEGSSTYGGGDQYEKRVSLIIL